MRLNISRLSIRYIIPALHCFHRFSSLIFLPIYISGILIKKAKVTKAIIKVVKSIAIIYFSPKILTLLLFNTYIEKCKVKTR